jgi:hypothetical protein
MGALYSAVKDTNSNVQFAALWQGSMKPAMKRITTCVLFSLNLLLELFSFVV